jgi:hypothetical protein
MACVFELVDFGSQFTDLDSAIKKQFADERETL